MHIAELELTAAAPHALAPFYAEVLGLPISLAGGALAVRVGASLLRFVPGQAGVYHFAMNVPRQRIADAVVWLAPRASLLADSAGQTVFHTDSWDSDAVYFRDPVGNILELIARHSLPDEPPDAADAPFGPQCLRCISEIGIACDDVPASIAAYCALLGAQPYSESSASFAPIGDERGLLILVKTGRVWFPETGIPAARLPLTVRADGQTIVM